MIARDTLSVSLDAYLQSDLFKDYCPNGLQVEGKNSIQRIMTGVTACQALIDRAVAWQADALIVHHGFFWKGEAAPLTGIKKQRIAHLISNDINLFAYHLPLDCHPTLGNNACLGKLLGIDVVDMISVDKIRDLVWIGELDQAVSPQHWQALLTKTLGRTPLHLSAQSRSIKRLAWCTGAAQRYINIASDNGADAYISGEVSESSFHLARELGIHYYACGHHATERYGIQALGEYLAQEYGIEHQFVDIDNPA